MNITTLTQQEMNAILNFEHPNPFEVLGMHEIQYNKKKALAVRAFFPEVEQAVVHDIKNQKCYPMTRINGDGFFEAIFPNRRKHFPYQIEIIDIQGKQKCFTDVFSFSPILSDDDLKLFREGKHIRSMKN